MKQFLTHNYHEVSERCNAGSRRTACFGCARTSSTGCLKAFWLWDRNSSVFLELSYRLFLEVGSSQKRHSSRESSLHMPSKLPSFLNVRRRVYSPSKFLHAEPAPSGIAAVRSRTSGCLRGTPLRHANTTWNPQDSTETQKYTSSLNMVAHQSIRIKHETNSEQGLSFT